MYRRIAVIGFLFAIAVSSALGQVTKTAGGLRGQVTDPSGAVVVGASVTVTTPDGQTKTAVSDKQGSYLIPGLPVGNVTVRATAIGFTPFDMPNVIIPAGQTQQLDIAFGIAVKKEQVTVQSESATVDVNPSNNASATVLKEQDLEAFSDDPDELEQDLLALAGPSVGPNGGQIYIDGFSNGTLPPKSSIREVRINQNPFSAEYDRAGFGRVEVFTKPGTDKWHGQVMFNENNGALNSQSPYVLGSVPPYHSERYSGNVSGAITKNMSLFFNAERRDINELSAIDAWTVDPNAWTADPSTPVIPVHTTAAVLAPETRNNLSSRLDWQLTPSNTLTSRYQFMKNDEFNQGIGAYNLDTRADDYHHTQSTVQLSDTQVLSPHVINETRFQYIRDSTSDDATQSNSPAINVLGEFNGGGSTVGQATDTTNMYELQNYTSWSVGKHFVKFGGRLRVSQDDNFSNANSNGTFTYSGGLQSYRDGTPSQFSIVSITNPRAELSFADVGLYAEDDWKVRPNLTFSYGTRFESQSSISDKADFAPRLGLSWGLGNAKSAPKTVVRLGYGIFYDRFPQNLVLQAQRLNGSSEQQIISSGPISCTASPRYPSQSNCSFSQSTSSPTIYQINPTLRAPYTMQTALSLEQQLGKVGTISFTYLNSRGVHQLVLENINDVQADGTRPIAGDDNNIYQYNSEAIFKQNQLITNVQLRVSQKVSLMGFYSLGYANSDSSGASGSPSSLNQHDLSADYGRAGFDVRNRLFLSGTLSLAHNIRISPFVIANSGAPFNITTGQDNGNTFYNQRPSFGTPGAPGVVTNQYGSFNLTSTANEIPINYGKGPSSVQVNMRLSKTFGFGSELNKGSKDQSQSGPGGGPGPGGPGRGGPGGGPGGGMGGPRGMGSIFGPSNTSRRYNLTISAMARNLFNTVNPGSPTGNLSSSMFGKSNSLAGGPFSSGSANRRIDLQATFSF